jgi:hypothetical protein
VVVMAVPRGVGEADPVAGVVGRVQRVAVAERRVLLAVTAVRPNAVENSIRRNSSASASWTLARGMRAVTT